jgi:hypothetical protein
MSQGAVFKLVLRDERFDKFFQASDFLRARLDRVRSQRHAEKERLLASDDPNDHAAGIAYNIQPTFVDIEKTHILYVHSAYRPYVSIASEYTRVKPGGDGTTSIGVSGGTMTFTFPIYGHWTSDMVLHIKVKDVGNKAAYVSNATPTVQKPLLRYCAYPGLRALRCVSLKSDAVLIDDYTTDDAVAYMKMFVGADQRVGWDRCHGQQEERQATYSANGFMGTLNYRDGPQTPKTFHEGFDMFIPFQFWCCTDVSRAVLNDLIPNTQRTIQVDLAPLKDIIQAMVPASVLPAPDVANLPLIGYTAVDLPFTKLGIETDLYVNNLYTNPEIHDIFASRIGFSLFRGHRRQRTPLAAPEDKILLSQLKFPAEYLLVGMRDRKLAADFDRWWLMGTLPPKPAASRLVVPAIIWNDALQINQLVVREAVETSTLESFTESLGLIAHGTELFPQLPSAFYNSYLPIRYAESSVVVSPVDKSEFLVTLCLYPGKPNVSGYYNLSAGRELYLNYKLKQSMLDFNENQYEAVITMSALNFLIRRGDKLHLKYAM